jgi:hypothetical protein
VPVGDAVDVVAAACGAELPAPFRLGHDPPETVASINDRLARTAVWLK